MHSPELRQKFVERRAQGQPFKRIATELGVAKSTLIEWSRQLRFEIQNHRTIELDDLRERIGQSRPARVNTTLQQLARVREELAKRDLAQLSTARLFALEQSLQRQLDRDLDGGTFITPVKDIPAGEYVEEVQEWRP
ncbi:MAG: hypothetical protein RLY20_2851 [Verrucomicrobiota bacterium]